MCSLHCHMAVFRLRETISLSVEKCLKLQIAEVSDPQNLFPRQSTDPALMPVFHCCFGQSPRNSGYYHAIIFARASFSV